MGEMTSAPLSDVEASSQAYQDLTEWAPKDWPILQAEAQKQIC